MSGLPKIDSSFQVYKQQKFEYKEIIKTKENILIDGAFQSYKYFDSELLIELLEFPPEVIEIAQNNYLIDEKKDIINIRRGDYLLIPHKFPVCSLHYFRRGIQNISDPSRCYLVISDDLNWVKSKFKDPKFIIVKERNPLLHLYLLTQAKT